MPHDHDHARKHGRNYGDSHVPRNVSGRTMGTAVTLTLIFVVVEALCGWLAHSLALLSDAGHNLVDVAALGFSCKTSNIASTSRTPPCRWKWKAANRTIFTAWDSERSFELKASSASLTNSIGFGRVEG